MAILSFRFSQRKVFVKLLKLSVGKFQAKQHLFAHVVKSDKIQEKFKKREIDTNLLFSKEIISYISVKCAHKIFHVS